MFLYLSNKYQFLEKKTLGELRSKRAKPLIKNTKKVVDKFQGRYYKLDIEIKK